MSRELGVPPLSYAQRFPRAGFTRDSGFPLLDIAFDEPLPTSPRREYGVDSELTACQERIATAYEVPLTYEVRQPRYGDRGTRPLRPILGLQTPGITHTAKIADVQTSPNMDQRQRKGLRKMEKVGGMLLGLFVDRPVRNSASTTVREPTHISGRNSAQGVEVLHETAVTEHRHTRRGVQVGLGLPRILDRSRSLLGFTGISNRGYAIILSALAGGALATPWVELPEGTAEKIETVAEDVSGGRVDIGEIALNIPNIRIPFPAIGINNALETVTVDCDSRQVKEEGVPTVLHTTEVIPGDTPEATVKLTQFGLGNFEGYVGLYDLTELESVLTGLSLEDISVINISASASDESQQDIASATCGIGIPNTENEQLAQQRADEITSYLITKGVKPENIQTLDIGEKVISEKLTELQTLVSANNITIQQACEYYNTNQQDRLPETVRSFFDAELAANRYAVVDFYTGEERPATIIENSSSCTIDTEITEYVDEHVIFSGDFPFSFDWNGNGIDLKGNSFGMPTVLVAAWGVLVFGQISRRQRTISKLETAYREVFIDADGGYQPYVAERNPNAPARRSLQEAAIPPGCAVPSWKVTVPFVALLALAAAASQCEPSNDISTRHFAPTELTKDPSDLVPCEETVNTTRVGSGVHAGEIYDTSTTTRTVSVPNDAIKNLNQ